MVCSCRAHPFLSDRIGLFGSELGLVISSSLFVFLNCKDVAFKEHRREREFRDVDRQFLRFASKNTVSKVHKLDWVLISFLENIGLGKRLMVVMAL